MINAPDSRSYQIQPDEKITSVMAYTADHLVWGEVVTKQAVRVSTWLRTIAMPEFITIHEACVVIFSAGSALKTQLFRELYLPSSLVIAFHMRPPAQDPLDYDPQEKMRKMEPATALVGPFRFECKLRISEQTNLERFLETNKQVFTALYDVEITQPSGSSVAPIRAPFALVRPEKVLFIPRTS